VAGKATGRPSDLELEILKVLWERGPSTVAHVHEVLAQKRPIVYNTVLKTLQIMTEKRLVVRDERSRAHVYRSRESRRVVVRRLVGDLLRRALDGSTPQLVVHALEQKRVKPDELEEIRQLIDEYGRRQEGVRSSAAASLGAIGPAAAPAVPALRRLRAREPSQAVVVHGALAKILRNAAGRAGRGTESSQTSSRRVGRA
jgi:predicted transcriptional regulator